MKWLIRTEHEITADIRRDEEELKSAARLYTHTILIAGGIIICGIFYTIGAGSQIFIFFPWLVQACQEYVDYQRKL